MKIATLSDHLGTPASAWEMAHMKFENAEKPRIKEDYRKPPTSFVNNETHLVTLLSAHRVGKR